MKVIFLDIDGVLNSRTYDRKRNWNEQTDIDETRLPLVKKIVDETGAKIVLSSTWREHWSIDHRLCDNDGVYINKTFAKYGLEIYDKTPDLGIDFDRPDEIKAWLDSAQETIDSFVIIDDYRYAWGKLSDNFVKTNPNFGLGLEEEHVKKAMEILIPDKKSNRKAKYQISVLGDSISTYIGYNPVGYKVYYKDDKVFKNDIASVDDTWWKQVIDGIGGELCVNNSFSGSMVVGAAEPSACSKERCSNLHDGAVPDIILIYTGTNDRGFEMNLGLNSPDDTMGFYGAYRAMLRQIKINYPSAKIVCGTLLMGRLKEGQNLPYDRFMREDSRYNGAIRLAVKEEGCLLADIALSGERYETLDYCHPTKNGHNEIAKIWLEKLKPLLN